MAVSSAFLVSSLYFPVSSISEVFHLSSYFIAMYGQDLFFFYPSDNMSNLMCRIWRNGRYLPEFTLHEGIRPSFSVFRQKERLNVFCQDIKGHILLHSYKNDKWNSRRIMHNSGNILLTPIESEDTLCVIYNGISDTECLFKRTTTPSGEWQQAETIDHFKPLPFAPYEAQKTVPGHLLLFYQTQTEECQVGYREVTPKRTGAFHRFLNTQGSLADASCLTTYDKLHVLMIVKTALSCQMLYRKKTDDVFTPPILLWEAPKIEQCLLTIIEDEQGSELHATCMIGGKLHKAVSADEGDSFGPMSMYKRKFCTEPVKANFLTEKMPVGYFARQVYVDKAAPWDVQMLPDLCQNFYPQGDIQDRLAAAERLIEERDLQIMELLSAGSIAK